MSVLTKENNLITKFQTSYLEVNYNEKRKIVAYKWIGHIMETEAKTGMAKILDIIKETKSKNLLADITSFKGGSVDTAKWVNDVWSQQLVNAGLRNVAVNVPLSAFGEFSNKIALGEKFISLLKVEKFTSLDEAYSWFEKNA
jgi:hypothetical protein